MSTGDAHVDGTSGPAQVGSAPLGPQVSRLPGQLAVSTAWRAVRRRWGRILALALAVGILAALIASALEPVYRSTVALLVDPQARGIGVGQDDRGGHWLAQWSGDRYLRTQTMLIRSQALAQQVAERLDLWGQPGLDPRRKAPSRAPLELNPASWLPSWLPTPKSESLSEAQTRQAVVEALTRSVDAEAVPDSQILRISFDARDPELAARVATAYADAYIELGLETRLETIKKAATWLGGRLDGLREKLEASESALQHYRESEGLVDTDGGPNLAEKELSEVSGRLVESRARCEDLDREYAQASKAADLDGSELAAHPLVARNPVLQTLKADEVQAERNVAELGKRYGDLHPKMLAARSDLETLKAKMRAEIDSTIQGVKTERDTACSRADQIQRDFDQAKSKVQEVKRKESRLRALRRDVETDRQLYELFLARFKEADQGTDLESTNARVIDPARVSGSPVSPRRTEVVGAAVLGALVLGVLLALLEDRLDNTLKTAEDLEAWTGLPTLGAVPLRQGRRRVPAERCFLEAPKSDFAEAIRTVRTAVVLSGLDEPHRVVLVTSTVPGEGKTTVAINLALAMSQVERVLLLDADPRRASIGAKLGLPADSPGLSALVAGTAPLEDCIQRLEGAELDVLPAGVLPANPLELLTSHRFAETLAELKGRYDRVVLDSAPAQAVSDALVLSRLCDAVILVVKADSAPRDLVQLAVKRLRRVDAPLIGTVLGHFDSAKAARYAQHAHGRWGRYLYAYGGYSCYDRDGTKDA
jgi:succinoglycan biosynthesis transport protein ExoP